MTTTIQTIQTPKKYRALDTSGNNNHGQIYSGRALEFDGVTDYLTTDNMDMSGGDVLTICTWVYSKPTGSGDEAIINQEGNFRLITNKTNNNITFTVATSNNAWYNVTVYTDLQDNNWSRVIALYDGSNMKIYINGILSVTSNSITGNILNTSASNFDIGRTSNTPPNLWNGNLCDLQLWDTAWSAADVTYDYLNPESLALNRGGTSLTNSNLKLWYPMQDGHRGQQSYILDGANTGLGDELVVNGTFDTDLSGWSTAGTVDGSNYVEYNNGGARLVTDGTGTGLVQTIMVVGVTYKLTFDVIDATLGSAKFDGAGISFSSVDSYTTYFKAAQTTLTYYRNSGAADITIDNVSLKPVNDKNHATTVFYGDELVANGGFETNVTGWSDINGSLASGPDQNSSHAKVGAESLSFIANAAEEGLQASFTTVTGRTYKVDFWVKPLNSETKVRLILSEGDGSGWITTSDLTLSSYSTAAGTVGSGNWYNITHEYVEASGGSSATIRIASASDDADGTFAIDEVSIKEVGLASGWTDADQQLHIPQTALQSYNQLAMFPGVDPGTDCDVTIADNADDSLDNIFTGGGTFSAWILPFSDGAGSYGRVADKGGIWRMLVKGESGGQCKLGFFHAIAGSPGTDMTYTTSATDLTLGQWAYVAGTYNRTTEGTAPKIYINGREATISGTNGDGDANSDTGADCIIGNKSDGTNTFDGCITEVSLWGVALTATQIQELYNDGKALDATTHSVYTSDSTNLKSYLRNNGLSTWTDLSTYTNPGTVNNLTETILIPQGSGTGITEQLFKDGRDAQGFLMNRQKDTSSLNLDYIEPDAVVGGNGSYVDVPGFDFHATTMSISFWIKANSLEADATILDKYVTSGNLRALRLYIITSQELQLQLSSTGSNNESQKTTDANLAVDTWYHIVITYSSGTWLLYKDTAAVSLDESGLFGTTTSIYQNTTALRIGHSQDVKDPFDGVIDNLLIYNDVLTSTEVERNYNAGKGTHRN